VVKVPPVAQDFSPAAARAEKAGLKACATRAQAARPIFTF
jgi:hypothetical protein